MHTLVVGSRRCCVWSELSEELNFGRSTVGVVKRSMYGCRDADHNWELDIARVMMKLELVRACLTRHTNRLHVNDVVRVGSMTLSFARAVRAVVGPNDIFFFLIVEMTRILGRNCLAGTMEASVGRLADETPNW